MPRAGIAGRRGPRLLLYGGGALPALVLPLLWAWGTESALALMLLTGWTLLPALAVALPLLAARRGLHPLEAFWPPAAGYALGWLSLRLPPPGVPLLIGAAAGLLAASAGQELLRRRGGT